MLRAHRTDTETYSVALSFEDGVTRFITCRDDQTVADASYRQRINIPLDCRDGACGTCKALCESGNYDGGTYIDDALPPDEAAAGYVLPCSMKPRSDLVLQIASTSDVAKTQAATYTGTVDAARPAVGHHRRHRRGDPEPRRIGVPARAVRQHRGAGHRPDAFVLLLQRPPRRAAHLPGEADPGRRDVGLPGFSAPPSATPSSFTGPNGSFFLRETDRPVLLLAGGTGLAPVLSMLRTLRDADSRRKAHLVYGVSTDEDLVAARRDPRDRLCSTRIHLGLLRLGPEPRAPTTRAM